MRMHDLIKDYLKQQTRSSRLAQAGSILIYCNVSFKRATTLVALTLASGKVPREDDTNALEPYDSRDNESDDVGGQDMVLVWQRTHLQMNALKVSLRRDFGDGIPSIWTHPPCERRQRHLHHPILFSP